MVEVLSARTGAVGDARGRMVWAEVAWPTEHALADAAFEHVHEHAISATEQALRRRFGEFLAWYGRETLRWWACRKHVGAVPTGLISAPTAADLADLLARAGRERSTPGRASAHGEPLPPG